MLVELFHAGCSHIAAMGQENFEMREQSSMNLLMTLVVFLVYLSVVLLIGRWLWNRAVVPLVSFAKPTKNMWQILGLFLFSNMLLCR